MKEKSLFMYLLVRKTDNKICSFSSGKIEVEPGSDFNVIKTSQNMNITDNTYYIDGTVQQGDPLLYEKEILLSSIKPLYKSVLSDMDIQARQHEEQLKLKELAHITATDLTDTEYIDLLKRKEECRQLSKLAVTCVEHISTEQDLTEAKELFKADFTLIEEVRRVTSIVKTKIGIQ